VKRWGDCNNSRQNTWHQTQNRPYQAPGGASVYVAPPQPIQARYCLTRAQLAGMTRKLHTASTLAKHLAHDPRADCLGIACASAAAGVLDVDAILDCLCLLTFPTRLVTGIRSRLGRLHFWWGERDGWLSDLRTVNHSLDDGRSADGENNVRKRVGCDWTRVAGI